MPEDNPNPGPAFVVKGQYVKDLSFENPNAPHSLGALDKRPNIDVRVDLKSQKLQDNFYEVGLYINVKAATEQGVLFLTELTYAGIFELIKIPADKIEPLLWIDGPFVLFPFARRVIADVTRDGGFPPLMLDPIDFQSLYMQHKARSAATAG